jgi:hypothetical protein
MTLVWAILFLVGGFVLRFQINKRQFNRRNAAGVEEFKSYGSAFSTQILEKIGRWVGLFLIIIGIFFAVSFFFDGSNKKLHESRSHINSNK